MTVQEVMAVIERERVRKGMTQAALDDRTWRTPGCYYQALKRVRLGGSIRADNLFDYASTVGMEITIRKKKELSGQ